MEDKEVIQKNDFMRKELIPVDERVKTFIETVISMVWNKHVGKPTFFNVIYASRITDPKTGQPINWSSEYDSNNDSFKFALDTIPERIRIGLQLSETCFIVAAHEAVHKVQLYRGDELKPSPKNITSKSHDYFDDRHETEAWREALDAFKKVFPGLMEE